MDREVWRRAAYRILHPAPWLLTVLSLVSFPLTFYFLWSGDSSSWIACTVYSLAAYSLTALCVGLPGAIAHLRTSVHESRLVRRLGNTETARRMANDGDFRRSAVMIRGIAANAVYAAFRVFTGLRLSSVWFLSIAFYYAALAALKACVAVCFRHAAGRSDRTEYECRCMEKISRLVLLIDLPMGVMIFQMVIKNSSYNYPGSMIYLSALHTFYTAVVSIINFVGTRTGTGALVHGAKMIDCISASMSLLGLQTALLARFSPDDIEYRFMMNALTGAGVFALVIIFSVWMSVYSKKIRNKSTSR